MKIRSAYIILAAAIISFCSCEKSENSTDREITFGAATSFENSVDTKTEYSGELVEERRYERINWVPGEDRVRILCKNAEGGPSADYLVTSATNSLKERNSYAQISATGTKLYWGEGEHCFFALYPAAGMISEIGEEVLEAESRIVLDEDGTAALVEGVIPSEQGGKLVGRIFKSNMNYAYMAASVKTSPGEEVKLSFKPLVTALEFNLIASGDDVAASDLVSLKLKSYSTKLTGSFSTTLDCSSNTHSDPVLSDTGDEVTVNLGEGIRLSKNADEATRITVLTLPVDQTDLVATLNFRRSDGLEFSRSLALKENGQAITVHACRKVYIRNLGVPDDLFIFEVDSDLEGFPAIGGEDKEKNYTIVSYKKTSSGEKEPVAWTVTFDTEDGGKPSWLDGFTMDNSENMVTEPVEMAATVLMNRGVSTSKWPGTGSNSTEENAQDLSLKDGVHEGTSRSSANCYVVTAPGWYKLPAVYGNSLIGGSDNKKAYHYVNGNGYISDELEDGTSFTPFVNSQDRPVSTPWIIPDVNSSSSSVEAVLCWQDSYGLTSNWTFREDSGEGYVYFYVDPETIAHGNAVIAIKEKAGDILWSWHIWVSLDKHSGTSSLKARTSIASTVVESNEMLNVPVGWCEPETFVAEKREVWATATQAGSGKTVRFLISQKDTTIYTYGNHPYYQWGRKDPMLPASGEIGKNADKAQFGEYPWRVERIYVSAGTAIRNPNVFYNALDQVYPNRSWFIESDYINEHHSFWDSGMGNRYDVDRTVIKTIYDPCPVGFCIPNRNAFTAFSLSELDTQKATGLEYFNSPEGDILVQNDGYYYYRFYSSPEGEGSSVVTLPALGYRETGTLSNVSAKAYAWTASSSGNENHDGNRMYVSYSNKQVHPLSDYHVRQAYGAYAVREQ